MQSVLFTSQQSSFAQHLIEIFTREGYNVFIAGIREPHGKTDIYIDTSDVRDDKDIFTIRSGIDHEIIRRVYEANVLRPMQMLGKYLPLLDRGTVKRLCFISGSDASINETQEISGYAYKMSKAAMHNFYMMAWNTLSCDGYTFRVFDPLMREPDAQPTAQAAFVYFTTRRGTENSDKLRDDENRLVLRDANGREHPW